jgi:hypothetical protein
MGQAHGWIDLWLDHDSGSRPEQHMIGFISLRRFLLTALVRDRGALSARFSLDSVYRKELNFMTRWKTLLGHLRFRLPFEWIDAIRPVAQRRFQQVAESRRLPER